MQDFVCVRGGGYFFMPGRCTVRRLLIRTRQRARGARRVLEERIRDST
jgi:hypothetical protein